MKPILFNNPMVRAILDGRKTQTRRVLKGFIPKDAVVGFDCFTRAIGSNVIGCRGTFSNDTYGEKFYKLAYQKGDNLYVRETWAKLTDNGEFAYKADNNWSVPYWHPSIHMPKEAARLFLHITDVRAERLKNISIDDIEAEGIEEKKPKLGSEYLCDYCPLDEPVRGVHCYGGQPIMCEGSHCDEAFEAWVKEYKDEFASLWDSTIKKADINRYGWEANPWVLVYSFERISKEVAFGDKIGGSEADNGVIMPAT